MLSFAFFISQTTHPFNKLNFIYMRIYLLINNTYTKKAADRGRLIQCGE